VAFFFKSRFHKEVVKVARNKDKLNNHGKATKSSKQEVKMPLSQKIGLFAGLVFIIAMSLLMLQGKGFLDIPGFPDESTSAENLGLTEEELQAIEEKLDMLKAESMKNEYVEEIKGNPPHIVDSIPKYYVYLSLSDAKSRAHVLKGEGENLENAWISAREEVMDFIKDRGYAPVWVKVDIVDGVNQINTSDLKGILEPYYEHFYKKGLAFDEGFQLSLIESEINGNKVIDYDEDEIDLKRTNDYLREYKNIELDSVPDTLYEFSTIGFFIDETNTIHELYRDELNFGRRIVENPIGTDTTKDVIYTSTQFLMENMLENGKYIYGYFPTYDMEIDNYNILRHTGTSWSLIIQYKITGDPSILPKAEKGIEYLLEDALVYRDENTAYIVERKADEIKLGGNAVAIIMLTSYMEEFDTDIYLDEVIALGNGILELQNHETGEYYHVLNYPDFSKKEEYRTVYYDGEATFALGKLYSMTGEKKWLDAAEIAVDNFIEKDYTKYRDHWVAYSVNEITKHLPEERFFEFGLRNAQENLERIYNQKTSYHTYLELLMVTFELYERIIEQGHDVDYLEEFNIKELVKTINHRAFHMLNGYFYPEYAMYFKNPQRILGTFFVRHDAFRIRIDDVQHFIGGYYNYYIYYDKLQSYITNQK